MNESLHQATWPIAQLHFQDSRSQFMLARQCGQREHAGQHFLLQGCRLRMRTKGLMFQKRVSLVMGLARKLVAAQLACQMSEQNPILQPVSVDSCCNLEIGERSQNVRFLYPLTRSV